MATRTITIALEAKVGGLVAGFKTASQAASDFGSKTASFAEKNRESLEGVGKAGALAGGVLVAGFAKSIQTFASFDKAMSSVQAATHESAENMELLSEAAIKAGADTAFSAEESATAIEEMAKAGVSTADILNGGLNGALSLAAAGALGVGEAAETAASAMTQFKLKGSDIPHIADLLAAGAGKAQGSVHDLGMALNQTGLVASQTGLTIEETTGGLAAFASAGLVGSDAGTSFKTMLQRLNPQSEAAANLMAELGLSAYDSQGEFIGLSEYAGKLQGALKDMSSEQRNAAMQTLFGSDAVRAAAVLYEQGAVGVQEWEEAVNDAGYAAETAALMQNNLAGDLEKLGGAFDTVFLKAGGTGNDGLRGLVQSAEDVVDAVGKIPAPVLGAIGVVGGLAGGALLLGGAFFTLAPRVFETIGHIRALNAASPGLATNLGKIGKAAGIAGAGFIAMQILGTVSNSMADATVSAEELSQSFLKASKSGKALDEVIGSGFVSGYEGIDSVGAALKKIQDRNFTDTMDDWVKSMSGFKSEIHRVEDSVGQLDIAISDWANSGDLEQASTAFRSVAESAKAQGISVEDTAKSFPGYLDSLRRLATDSGVALGTTSGLTEEQELLNWAMGETPPAMLAAAAASEETATALGDMGSEAQAAVVPLEDIVAALFALGMISMSSRDSTAAFHQALRDMYDATVAAGDGSLGLGAVLNELGTDFDLTTEAGAAANAAFQNIATAGMADVEAKAREGMGQPELQANLQNTYNELINAANGMGIEGAAAEDLARKVFSIPADADTTAFFHDAAAKLGIQQLDQQLNNIDGKTVNTYVRNQITTVLETLRTGDTSAPAAHTPGDGVRLPGRAAGGAIYGRGTGTSDTAGIFALSNGEHVLTASEVQAMGGQSAVYAFRAQLDAGVPAGFSAPAREFSAPPAMNYGSGSNSSSSIDYERLAAAIESRPVIANLRIGNRDVAQANIQGRKELRLP